MPHLFNPCPCNLKSQFAFFTPHLPSHSVQLCLFSPFLLPPILFNFLRGFLPHLSKEVRPSCFAPLLLSNILLKARLRTLARSFVEEFFTSLITILKIVVKLTYSLFLISSAKPEKIFFERQGVSSRPRLFGKLSTALAAPATVC